LAKITAGRSPEVTATSRDLVEPEIENQFSVAKGVSRS
jgi:hypothetical protein